MFQLLPTNHAAAASFDGVCPDSLLELDITPPPPPVDCRVHGMCFQPFQERERERENG